MRIAFLVIGVLCVLYGVFVMTAWSGSSFFAVWYALGALCLALAWVMHAGIWDTVPAMAKRVAGALATVVLAAIVIAEGCALSGFGEQGEHDLDYIVVLGAQVKDNGPSLVLQHRLDTARDYLQANPRTQCVVTGAQGPNEPRSEASAMAEYLAGKGISADRIILEEQARNTVGNITYSMQLFDPQSARVGIVTNDFHVFRSLRIARKQGIRHVCGISAPSTPAFLPNNLLREGMGIVKDLCAGNLT